MFVNRLGLLWLLAGACLATGGCGKPSHRKPVFPVSGTAQFHGEPMEGARLGFHRLYGDDERAISPTGRVESDGSYTLTTYLKGDGAPAGEYAVTIYWPGDRKTTPNQDPTDEDDGLPPDRLRRAYAMVKSTALRATVREEANTIDFHLPQ